MPVFLPHKMSVSSLSPTCNSDHTMNLHHHPLEHSQIAI